MALLCSVQVREVKTQTKKTYTISYNKNGGKGTMNTQTATVGSKVTLKANGFTKKGYVFTGWNTKKNGKGITYLQLKQVNSLSKKAGKKIVLYAQWKKGIVVNLNANSGKVDIKSNSVLKGKKYGTYASLPQATKAGYDFKGWYTKKTGGKKVTDKTTVTIRKKQTLYARYAIKTYGLQYPLLFI